MIGQPPLTGDIIQATKPYPNRPSHFWSQWFLGLYNALGGNTGIGVLYLTTRLPSVKSATPAYIAIPKAGILISVVSCLQGAIGALGCTLTIAKTGTGTIGTIAIANSAPTGDVDTLIASTNNTLAINDTISITSNAAATNAVETTITLVIQYTN